MLQQMRWTDNSMGSNFDYGWSDINQAFAAGQVGMYVSGSDVFTNLVQASNIDPNIYGLAALPTAQGNPKAAVLGGGTLAAVRPNASADQIAAAVKWIDFYYEQPLVNKAAAIRNAKTLAASKQPIGVPALPVFDQQQYTLANTWIKSYINVPLKQMTGYTSGVFKQHLAAEPAASTQSIYHSLDAAVEAVLTTPDANIPALLAQANTAAQQAISSGS
jgi:ABC-type glycerol-3-phosphate transport system substrate-binding protein